MVQRDEGLLVMPPVMRLTPAHPYRSWHRRGRGAAVIPVERLFASLIRPIGPARLVSSGPNGGSARR